MLTSPITVTIDGTAHSLNRVNQDNFSAVYLKKEAGLEVQMTIRHSYEGKAGPRQMERHNVDLVHTTWDGDGNPVINQTYSVIRLPRGSDPDVAVDVTTGFNTFLTTNAAAIVAWRS